MDDGWMHSASLVKIADIFARTFTMMGNCCFPPYISRTEAGERFDVWRLLNERRMERLDWSSSGSDAEKASPHSSIALLRTIAGRNHSRPRRGFLRARRLTSQEDNVDVWGDDLLQVGPSGDESIPPESLDVPLRLPTYISLP